MASISSNADGRRTVQFIGDDRKRRSIRLGKISQRNAERFRDNVEHLIAALKTGENVDPKVREWLAKVDDTLHDRIARAGLVEPRESRRRHTIQSLVKAFGDSRKDVKDSTRAIWKQAHDSLVEVFGAGRHIDTIKPHDADDWRQKMIEKKLAESTIRKRTRNVTLLMNWAIRRGYLQSNPFADLPSTSIAGDEKPYVSREVAERVIDKLPNVSWRLFFALGRYAGLRLPSEGLALRWGDVDWERDRIRVPVPKLAHLPGKGERIIPLFADLRPLLQEAFDLADNGEERVVVLPDVTDTYLRKVVSRAIQEAKAKPWRCVFHSLRASCETDLMREHPVHVVCRWIGHDLRVAQKHYLQVTERDHAKAVQKAVQSGHAPGRMDWKNPKKTPPCKSMQGGALQIVGDEGFEPS